MNADLLEQLNELLKAENFGEVNDAAAAIAGQLSEELKKAQEEDPEDQADEVSTEGEEELIDEEEFIDDEADDHEEEEVPEDPLVIAAGELLQAYRDKRVAWVKAQKEALQANYAAKQDLIQELQNLIKEEENIGKAYTRIKEIHERWKEIGEVPKDRAHDLHVIYNKLNEDFYYNINIYKELREHDLKRNQGEKEALIKELEAIAELKSIKETDARLREVQTKWDEIGPTFKEQWAELKESYWTKVRALHKKIRDFYHERNEAREQHLKSKQELVERTKAIVEALPSERKDWEKATKAVLDIQKEWKGIGFASRKENEKIWQEFRGLCDTFFNAKKAFYGEMKEEFTEKREAKNALVEKAIALKDSTDWQETTHLLINLQKEWKKIGFAGPRHDNKLWRKFRGACDHFFTRKENHAKEQEKELVENLKVKEELLKKIEAHQPDKDQDKAVQELEALTKEFNATGAVPKAQHDKIFKAFRKAMDKHYNDLGLGDKQEEMMFNARLEQIKGAPNAEKLYDRERYNIKKEIKHLKDEIRQYENNLGFFGNSKGAEKLIKEVTDKIDRYKSKVATLESKLDKIPWE